MCLCRRKKTIPTHLPGMYEQQTWEAHQEEWLGRKVSAPSTTAPDSSGWAWRSSVDESGSLLKLHTSNVQRVTSMIFTCRMCISVQLVSEELVASRSNSRAEGRRRWSWSEGTWRGSWHPSARGCSRGACGPETGSQINYNAGAKLNV